MKARTMATILRLGVSNCYQEDWICGASVSTYIKYGNTILFLNVFATHIRFSGS